MRCSKPSKSTVPLHLNQYIYIHPVRMGKISALMYILFIEVILDILKVIFIKHLHNTKTLAVFF